MQEPKQARIILRTDPELKAEAQTTFEEMGLSLSQGINLYLKEVTETGKLPFTVQTKAARLTNEANEAKALAAQGKRKMYTPEEYFAHARQVIASVDQEND